MTELYFLDRSLAVQTGPIDDFVSLVWTERYDACGTFTLVLPMHEGTAQFSAILSAVYLEVRGRRGLGRVEKVCFSGGEYGGTITVSGRMAESLLSDRIIPRRTAVSGRFCAAIEELVAANACHEAGERAIPGLVVRHADDLTDADGQVLTLDDHINGKPLDEWLYEVLGAVGASYRIVPDFSIGALVFEIYRGLDRTQAQEVNTQAVFSASFSSAGTMEYLADDSDYRNFAYIAGEGEGDQRVEVTLDLRTDPEEPRRELYVDARDLRSDDGESVMSDEAYRNLLLARGKQRLLSHARVETLGWMASAYNEDDIGGDVPAWGGALAPIGGRYTSSMVCGRDYALGDLCDAASAMLDVVRSVRVTAVTYIYEENRVRVEPKLGTAYPDLRAYIRRQAADTYM